MSNTLTTHSHTPSDALFLNSAVTQTFTPADNTGQTPIQQTNQPTRLKKKLRREEKMNSEE